MLTVDKKNRISEVIKGILLKRIDNFPELDSYIRNAPFHREILNFFEAQFGPLKVEIHHLVAIASWLHGLNTSLGSGFENISHILNGGYKRKFSSAYRLRVKSGQASQVEQIIRDLKSGSYKPDLRRENQLIFNYEDKDSEVEALEFTVDNYIETDSEIVAIELKSVRPNSGEGRGEKQKILYGKAALKLLNPEKHIKFFIGFPFDPTADTPTGYDKNIFFDYLIEFKKFFDSEEVLLGEELWDFLSGSSDTMAEILEVIRETVQSVQVEN